MDGPIRVLHVDDEPEFADLTATQLQREDTRITVETATSAAEGLNSLTGQTDCIISDYDMPGMDGIEFLETVRDQHPALPFILYTGKGSEEIASEAISAGVTDYLQKGRGIEQYELLANRLTNAVEQARARTQAGEAQRRFQILFEQFSQPLVEVDYDGLEPIVTDVNPAFEETFGYDTSTIVGESLDTYIVPDDRQSEAEDINQYASSGGQLVSREVSRKTADGIREFLLENAVYEDESSGFAIYTDITDRKQREEALNALQEVTREFMDAEDKLAVAEQAVETARSVLDQPINGLWLYDSTDEKLQPVTMTTEAAEILDTQPAYSAGESLSYEAFVDKETKVYDNVQAHDKRFNDETPIQSEIILPLGEHGIMNIGSTEPATFSEMDISLARLFAKTVEAALDRADREQRLRDQRASLQRQNDRLDKFTGVVSHDLRSPLQVAETNIALAQRECESSHLDAAADALGRMETLIDDLLTVAREGTEVQETEPTSLEVQSAESWDCVETTDATLQNTAEHTVQADPSRLKQLLENLIRNAVDHGGEDVTVRIGELDDGFFVADDGPGIPEEERSKVFEAGYSTIPEGTGFGLNIVQEIVAAHGWNISVEESDAGGARFNVTNVDVVT